MTGSWTHYNCKIQDKPAQVLVNLEIRTSVPDLQRTTLLWIGVYCRMNPEGAFWNPSETEALDRVEDHLIRTVTTSINAAYVLRIATPGIREYYFYANSDTGFSDCVVATRNAFPEYRIESDQTRDIDWSRYLSFYDYLTQRK
jgi:hypothetical protein